MRIINLWIGALLLVAPLANAASYCSPPDSTVVSRSHLLTLNAPQSAGNGGSRLPTIGYEWRVRERWGVRTILGYERYQRRFDYTYLDPDGAIVNSRYRYRTSALLATAALNYYLQAHKPALVGWFVGAGLLARGYSNRFDYESPLFLSDKNTGLVVRPLLMAGRHWALGRRWLLDTHLSTEFYTWRQSDTRRRLSAEAALGLGVGYRF